MTTSSTLQLEHPAIAAASERPPPESRLRHLFRRRARLRRAVHPAWREEATLRAMTRLGA
jgi:hypothetical protein